MSRPKQVATDTEEVVDESVHGEESLHVSGGFKSSHLSFALPSRLVRHFRSIVLVLSGAVHHGRHHGTVGCGVAAKFVRDQPAWLTALPFQQRAEEAGGRLPIATRLHQDVDHIAILVDRPPEIVLPALHRDEQFIQVPRVTHPPAPMPEPPGVGGAKGLTPVSDGLVRDQDAPVSQEIFGVAEAETEAVIQPDGVADDLGREPVATVAGGSVLHSATVPAAPST